MSDWFFMLGEPLSAGEQRQARQYLRGLDLDDDLPVCSVPDWNEALRVISNPEWDRSWWDAEEREQLRLHQVAKALLGENRLTRELSRTLELIEAVHGAAAVEAARRDCSDASLIRVAAGAASQALYLAELARLAGAGHEHPFSIKAALFAGGHWPLGIANGHYQVF